MFVFLFASFSFSEIVTCFHDYYEHKSLREREPEPIRVLQETNINNDTNITSFDDPRAKPFKLLFKYGKIDAIGEKKGIIEDTFKFVQDFLNDRIKLYPSDAGELTITVVAISDEFKKNPNGLAYAFTTGTYPSGRPKTGEIHLNIDKLPDAAQTLSSGNRQFIMTVIHEFNHILSFSKTHFGKYKDENGKPALKFTDQDGNVIQNAAKLDDLSSYDIGHIFLNTPRLTKYVNEHFHVKKHTNLGLEIEDGGGSGTAESHPNERLFFTDLMQGRTYGPGWLSPIFYNTLWDTGWYIPSPNLIEEFVYLNDELNPKIEVTEDILLKPPQHSFPPSYLCTSEALNACFYDYTYTGVCSLKSWTEIQNEKNGEKFKQHEKWYNPDNQNKVGSDDLLDFANLVLPWYSCRDIGPGGLKRRIDLGDDYDSNKYGEIFGPNSTCALSTLQKATTGGLIAEPKCYDAWCGTDRKVRLMVPNVSKEFFCKRDGQQATFEGYAGSITCPPAAVVCANRELREIFGVANIFPDRGPIDGQNFVAITGSDFLKYQPEDVTIRLGTVNCDIKIYKDNYILCKLESVDDKRQEEILKGSFKVLKGVSDINIYRQFEANISSNPQANTVLPDMYVFTNRWYTTGTKNKENN